MQDDDNAQRLDRFLARHVPDLSRERLQRLIRDGYVRKSGRSVTQTSIRVRAGDTFMLDIPEAADATPEAQNIPLDILYEDEHLLVLVKPAGMVVHPAPGHAKDTLVNALLHHCAGELSGIGGVKRPGIVHRLDRDVSGVMVVAKTDKAHRNLAGQFAVHSLDRRYQGLVYGVPRIRAGLIDKPIGRHVRDRKRMAISSAGKVAKTYYKVEETFGDIASVVELRLHTGRTHQIRVHLVDLGHGLLGDPVYRTRKRRDIAIMKPYLDTFNRIALHARKLAFVHPVNERELEFIREWGDPLPSMVEELRQDHQI